MLFEGFEAGQIVIRVAVSLIPAIIAGKNGRRPVLWFVLGLISPILATAVLLILCIVKKNVSSVQAPVKKEEDYVEPGPATTVTPVKDEPEQEVPEAGISEDGSCPHCGAPVKKGAIYCDYCGGKLV